MAYKNTVAIIGATGNPGAFIAKAISKGFYRLLLMDGVADELIALQTDITRLNDKAEVDVIQCCKDASWEADIIVVAVAENEKADTAQKMKEVSTCKTVINFTSAEQEATDLQNLLPHSKVVNVSITGDIADTKNIVSIKAYDDEAMNIAVDMIKIIGLPFNVTQG